MKLPRVLSSGIQGIFLTALFAGVVYAGAGANGGNGGEVSDNSYQLVFGTISPASGSPIDFLATDANLNVFLSSFSTGDDSGTPPVGLDPRVYAGAAGLLLSPTLSYTALFTDPSNNTESIALDPTIVWQTVDDIWFSNGALGQIDSSDLLDPAQILAEAEALGVLSGTSGPFGTTSSPAGNVQFHNTIVQAVDNSGLEVFSLGANISLTELKFSAGQASVPEPSALWLGLIGFGAIVLGRKNKPRADAGTHQ